MVDDADDVDGLQRREKLEGAEARSEKWDVDCVCREPYRASTAVMVVAWLVP